MNSSVSAKDLFRSICIALVLMLAFAAVAVRAQPPAAPASEVAAPPPPSPTPTVAPVEEKAPAATMAPEAAPAAPTAPAPAATESKSELRRLDTPVSEPEPSRNRPSRRRSTSTRTNSGDSERVSFGHDVFLGKDERAEVVVAIMGSATSEGTVNEAVVSIMGDTRVSGSVGESAVAVMGNVYVNGKVDGQVVAIMGDVELGPEADVQGELVVVGGKVIKSPTAVTHRGIQHVAFADGNFSGFMGLRTWFRECFLWGRPLAFGRHLGWAWGIALVCLTLYVLIAALFRSGVEKSVRTLEERPGACVLAAILTFLLVPIIVVLLAITGVGIIALPFIGVGLFIATLFGRAVILAWLGRRLGNALALPLAVLIGGLIVLALYVIPVIGVLVYCLFKALALGVVVYVTLVNMRSDRPPAAPVVASGVPVVPLVPVMPVTPTSTSTAPSEGFTSGAPANVPVVPVVPVIPIVPAVASMASPEPMVAASSLPPVSSIPSSEPPTITPSAASAGFQSQPPPMTPPPVTPQPPPGFRLAPMAPVVPAITQPRAGFWIRTGAMLLDVILIGVLVGGLMHGGGLFLPALAAYGAVMWKMKGTTIGGIICGLKVVRLDDRPMDWPTAVVRALSCFLSMAVAGLGFIWVLFDDERQSWHDKIAGTVVVKMPKGVSLV